MADVETYLFHTSCPLVGKSPFCMSEQFKHYFPSLLLQPLTHEEWKDRSGYVD